MLLLAAAVDWSSMWEPTVSLLELMLRGSIMYLAILAMLRFFRREAGEVGPADLLLIVVVADAAQSGMASEYRSVTEGLVLVATIFGWNYLLDWLSFKSPAVHRLVAGSPLLLVRDGRVLHRHLRREFLSLDDLRSLLRHKGIDDFAEVAKCHLEPDGQISVIKRKS